MSLTVRTVFTTLFFVIITIFTLAAWLIFLYPSTGHIIISDPDNNEKTARFQVTTQRDELEKAINTYLHKHVQTKGLSFSVTLNTDLQFHGDVRIFGLKVPVSVGFDPILQSNGDLVLEQQYFQVGALSLPASVVLEYINRSYTFPEWIILQPVQRKVYLATTTMSSDSEINIHVQKFDLNKDELQFDVYLPGAP
ncbi:MAG: YpmS family protein [Paenibacillaceae bacterium]